MRGNGNALKIVIELIRHEAMKSVTSLENQPKVRQFLPEILAFVKSFAYSIVHISTSNRLVPFLVKVRQIEKPVQKLPGPRPTVSTIGGVSFGP